MCEYIYFLFDQLARAELDGEVVNEWVFSDVSSSSKVSTLSIRYKMSLNCTVKKTCVLFLELLSN